MGQALYRKYRSKSLEEVVGQEHITNTLAQALKTGRINHAYLFTGPRGTGKTSVARIIAHVINNLPYGGNGEHLDIIEIDAASNRRIDDIRDLREKVHVAPVSAPYKVYIIDEVHMLTGESFNALLKTLEEPPSHVVFILATTEVHKLPATIISRTQRYHFRPVELTKVAKHLESIAKQESIKIDDATLQLIAEHGEGSFRDSISLLDQLANSKTGPITSDDVEHILGLAPSAQLKTLVKALNTKDASTVHATLKSFEEQGVPAQKLTSQLINALQHEAATNPAFYSLIDELLDIPKNSNPAIKLLVVLMKYCTSGDSNQETGNLKLAIDSEAQARRETGPKKQTGAAEPQTKAAKPAALTSEPIPEISSTPAQLRKTPGQAKKVTHNSAVGKPLTIDDWSEVLDRLKTANPPLYSIIKRAVPTFKDDELILSFGFALHSKKLEDSRYRTKFTEVITNMGYRPPKLVTKVEKSGSGGKTKPDETTNSVLAMMGGGEIVNAET